MTPRLPAPTEIVLGPPGTGKTTELLQVVEEEMAAGTDPRRIGYYTFTRRGATEAQDRAMAKFGFSRADLPHFRTLHSEAMRQVGLTSSQVIEGPRLQEFGDWIGERIEGRFSMEEGLQSGYSRGDRMLFMDNLARVRQRTIRQQYDEDHDEIDWLAVDRFSRGLREFKMARALVDYTDMLEQFVARGQSPGLEVVVVDEGQDLSPLQWAVVAVLCRGARRAVVAADDDQNIYKWAGADVEHILRLEGQVRVLGQSFRVPRQIQALADGIVGRVRERRPKSWLPRADEGVVRFAAGLEEVDWTGPGVLVLARNQYLLTPVMRELENSGVLYERHGHPSVRQPILDAVVTWERLRGGEPQRVADVRKVYAHLETGVGVRRGHRTLPGLVADATVTIEDLRRDGGLLAPTTIWHEALTGIPARERSYMVRCRRRGERFSQAPRVRVGTIHDSKGGERDRVVLLTDMAPRTHAEMTRDPDSEHRVFYVGATRAREELVVVRPRTSRHYEV